MRVYLLIGLVKKGFEVDRKWKIYCCMYVLFLNFEFEYFMLSFGFVFYGLEMYGKMGVVWVIWKLIMLMFCGFVIECLRIFKCK